MRQDGMSGAETGDAAGSEAVPAIGPVGPISTPDEDLGALETPNPLGEIVLGNDDAPVTIVEYSSLTCPHCGAFHRDTLPALTEKYIDKGLVKIYFRPFPFDPYATAGAMLAHCVGPSARVSFLDILFKRQQQWIQDENPINALQALAKQAGLSESDFVVCLKDQKRLDGIRDMQSRAAEELGVRSTPTFFVNGDKLEGNQPLADFEKLIKPLLADFEGAQ
jgi:protein-disulfide isomerase